MTWVKELREKNRVCDFAVTYKEAPTRYFQEILQLTIENFKHDFGSGIKKNQKSLQIKYALITAVVANLGPILVSQPNSSYPHASHIEVSENYEASKIS